MVSHELSIYRVVQKAVPKSPLICNRTTYCYNLFGPPYMYRTAGGISTTVVLCWWTNRNCCI